MNGRRKVPTNVELIVIRKHHDVEINVIPLLME